MKNKLELAKAIQDMKIKLVFAEYEVEVEELQKQLNDLMEEWITRFEKNPSSWKSQW